MAQVHDEGVIKFPKIPSKWKKSSASMNRGRIRQHDAAGMVLVSSSKKEKLHPSNKATDEGSSPSSSAEASLLATHKRQRMFS